MAGNLDRFARGLPDPQGAAALATCAGCGGEIYAGEDVYILDGEILHRDWECVREYIAPALLSMKVDEAG